MPRDLQASLERLYALRTFGIKPGLETVAALVARLGNPQDTVATLHVAGTNGKGTVCALLDAMLRAAGYRVGLYTSPHLIRFNERIRIDGKEIDDESLARLFDDLEAAARDVAAQTGREATFFEFTTALAFEYFRRQEIRIVVLETGLGGRLDATNVVTPLLSVITRIGIDHAQYLGATLAAVAAEKAGIVKPGRPVICAAMPGEARAVIADAARGRNAPFVDAGERVNVQRVSSRLEGQKVKVASAATDYGTIRIPLLGRYQLENCAAAVAAVEALADISPIRVPPEAVQAGLSHVVWPGRLQVIDRDPVTILDGAHNPDAARALVVSLKELARKRPLGIVCGMCADKDNREFMRIVGGAARRCWTVPLRTARSRTAEELRNVAQAYMSDVTATATVPTALEEARAWAAANSGWVCITGSLYLVGEVLELQGYGQQQLGW
jgi:dihydrofolate synthase/folylpolyglutamate synthase